jgi:hypothetical protein
MPDPSAVRQVASRGDVALSCDETTGCQLCNGPLPEDHDHILDTQYCAVLCCCLACSEIFRPPRRR